MKLAALVASAHVAAGKSGLWYLASPYSKYPAGLDAAYRDICTVAATLMRAGVHVFCPIAHSHSFTNNSAWLDERDHEFWLRHDTLHLKRCDGMIVAKMDTWETSFGVEKEIKWCDRNDKPVLFLDVDEILGHRDGEAGMDCVMPARLPDDSAERKEIPLARGLLDYFPDALAYVAKISKWGNDKHNPGEEMHHARGKSSDHADCIARHLVDRGTVDGEGRRHSGYLAWRALALLQEELEHDLGLPLPRAAKAPEDAAAQAAVEGV